MKEQFEKILNQSSVKCVGRNFESALGSYGYPTISEVVFKAMQQAYDLDKSQSEATIENLASRVSELEHKNIKLKQKIHRLLNDLEQPI